MSGLNLLHWAKKTKDTDEEHEEASRHDQEKAPADKPKLNVRKITEEGRTFDKDWELK